MLSYQWSSWPIKKQGLTEQIWKKNEAQARQNNTNNHRKQTPTQPFLPYRQKCIYHLYASAKMCKWAAGFFLFPWCTCFICQRQILQKQVWVIAERIVSIVSSDRPRVRLIPSRWEVNVLYTETPSFTLLLSISAKRSGFYMITH